MFSFIPAFRPHSSLTLCNTAFSWPLLMRLVMFLSSFLSMSIFMAITFFRTQLGKPLASDLRSDTSPLVICLHWNIAIISMGSMLGGLVCPACAAHLHALEPLLHQGVRLGWCPPHAAVLLNFLEITPRDGGHIFRWQVRNAAAQFTSDFRQVAFWHHGPDEALFQLEDQVGGSISQNNNHTLIRWLRWVVGCYLFALGVVALIKLWEKPSTEFRCQVWIRLIITSQWAESEEVQKSVTSHSSEKSCSYCMKETLLQQNLFLVIILLLLS